MTRRQRIEQAASEIYTDTCWEYETMRRVFVAGALWADKNPWVKYKRL